MLVEGTLLQGRYRIKRLLAQGGMGAVYEATAENLRGLRVAVKETILGISEAYLREQFEREAALLAELRHPALPFVRDHFYEGAGQFLVMDFIPGDDLAALLERSLREKRTPLPVEQVSNWSDALLDALHYMHTRPRPIIHRDIKPQNIKLTPQGEVILIDFGLAKDATTLSRSGKSLYGYTLAYAPPEQIKGKGTDARSDLYSLAATLYHLLVGQPPVDARVREEVMKYGTPDPLPPLHAINPQFPLPFSQMLTRAMMLDCEQRYQSAVEMRAALRGVRRIITDRTQGDSEQPRSAQHSTLAETIMKERAEQKAAPIVVDLRQAEANKQSVIPLKTPDEKLHPMPPLLPGKPVGSNRRISTAVVGISEKKTSKTNASILVGLLVLGIAGLVLGVDWGSFFSSPLQGLEMP